MGEVILDCDFSIHKDRFPSGRILKNKYTKLQATSTSLSEHSFDYRFFGDGVVITGGLAARRKRFVGAVSSEVRTYMYKIPLMRMISVASKPKPPVVCGMTGFAGYLVHVNRFVERANPELHFARS